MLWISASWTLIYIDAHPKWKRKVSEELHALISRHANGSSAEPLHARLASIPMNAWEDEMPILELVIRETQRLTFNGAAMRRNVAHALAVPGEGKVIERGAFMTYSLADVHMDPSIYPSPEKFDPERFLPGREEDKKAPLAFLSWGGGRHPCAGVKVAKLEIKMIVAMFLAGYEYTVVDSQGKIPSPFPRPDRNDIHQVMTD